MAGFSLQRSQFSVSLRQTLRSTKARERRYRKICQLVGLRPLDQVLDVGCGPGLSFECFNRENEIVGLDLDPVQHIFQDNFQFVRGDASFMGFFEDGQFDLVVCIGVLPRVTPYAKLKRAAGEIARVGKAFAVVVPHTLTLVDPYSHLPFGQFTPQNFRAFSRRWSFPDQEDNPPSVEQKEPPFYLRTRDWKALFPGSMITSYSYMGLGLVRNFIIYKKRTDGRGREA